MTNDIKIIFEDESIIVADKPAGVLVHPTAANEPDTLVAWLLDKNPEISKLDWPDSTRAGIVHRLDKDTSGIIILAKNPETLTKLQEQFQSRMVKKTYQALVLGKTPDGGKIDVPIVRDSAKDMMKTQPMTFSFTRGTVRQALTKYKTIKRYRYQNQDLSLIEVYPQTGRMHQIRVHMKHEGFPLIGDQMYFNKTSKKISKDLGLDRQFLHAVKLEIDGQTFKSELAEGLKKVLEKLSQS